MWLGKRQSMLKSKIFFLIGHGLSIWKVQCIGVGVACIFLHLNVIISVFNGSKTVSETKTLSHQQQVLQVLPYTLMMMQKDKNSVI